MLGLHGQFGRLDGLGAGNGEGNIPFLLVHRQAHLRGDELQEFVLILGKDQRFGKRVSFAARQGHLGLLFLEHSQKGERQADRVLLDYAHHTGFGVLLEIGVHAHRVVHLLIMDRRINQFQLIRRTADDLRIGQRRQIGRRVGHAQVETGQGGQAAQRRTLSGIHLGHHDGGDRVRTLHRQRGHKTQHHENDGADDNRFAAGPKLPDQSQDIDAFVLVIIDIGILFHETTVFVQP